MQRLISRDVRNCREDFSDTFAENGILALFPQSRLFVDTNSKARRYPNVISSLANNQPGQRQFSSRLPKFNNAEGPHQKCSLQAVVMPTLSIKPGRRYEPGSQSRVTLSSLITQPSSIMFYHPLMSLLS